MPGSIVGTPQAFSFADGNAGHVCVNSDGPPGVGIFDTLFVNSNTTVSTPAGFAAAPTSVSAQGSYIFRREAVGGETDSVTITTSGNHPTDVVWVRGSNLIAADQAAFASAGGNATTTPAVSSGPLADNGETVFAFAALHNFATTPINPVWSAGYTPILGTSNGTGATAVAAFVAWNNNAGPGAEAPNVTWTNQASDRDILLLTFTAEDTIATVVPDGLALPLLLGEPELGQDLDVAPDGLELALIFGNPAVAQVSPLGPDAVTSIAETLLECLGDTVALLGTDAPGQVCMRVGAEVVHDLGLREDLCCEGLGYVSLGDVFPSTDSPPEHDQVRQANAVCGFAAWDVQFRVGIIRCIPVGDEFAGPTCDEWTAAALRVMRDSQALRRVACCFLERVRFDDTYLNGQLIGMSVVMNRQVQGEPQGGCVERYFTIDVQIPNCDCGSAT